MAAFFPKVLDEFLSPDFLAGVRNKFHYGETQKEEFQSVAEEMLPLMRKEAFWERKASFGKQFCRTGEDDINYEDVVMSLGHGVDSLQEKYSETGMLSKSYMVEVLAGELLLRAYEAYNCYMKEKTDWHVARYHFPGSEEDFPLETLPDLLKDIAPEITCNAAFCMVPKKSVAFVAELTKDEQVQCRGVCVGCNNTRCPNRIEDDSRTRKRITEMTDMPLTYGYSRILGKWRV